LLFKKSADGNKKMRDYILISNWLDKILSEEIPDVIVAFNFNLYEGSHDTYDVQLIGSDIFDEEDDDWACNECFTSGENICYIQRTEDIKDWEKGLEYITELVKLYIAKGKRAEYLKNVSAVGIGFVDGDINIIYRGH